FAAVDAAWAELEQIAPISVYQTRRWLRPWCETVGRAAGVEPMLVVARDRQDVPVALLPFGSRRRGLIRIVDFLGAKDSNANLGLFRPGLAWTAADIAALIA